MGEDQWQFLQSSFQFCDLETRAGILPQKRYLASTHCRDIKNTTMRNLVRNSVSEEGLCQKSLKIHKREHNKRFGKECCLKEELGC